MPLSTISSLPHQLLIHTIEYVILMSSIRPQYSGYYVVDAKAFQNNVLSVFLSVCMVSRSFHMLSREFSHTRIIYALSTDGFH